MTDTWRREIEDRLETLESHTEALAALPERVSDLRSAIGDIRAAIGDLRGALVREDRNGNVMARSHGFDFKTWILIIGTVAVPIVAAIIATKG